MRFLIISFSSDLNGLYPWKQSYFFENGNLSEETSWKNEENVDVETLAKKNFSQKSPEENPAGGEEHKEKKEKGQAEEDFTIKVESEGEEKSVIVIDW